MSAIKKRVIHITTKTFFETGQSNQIHVGLPCDEITRTQNSASGETKTNKDLYYEHEKTGINNDRVVQHETSETAIKVPDADFWEDLNDGKIGNTRQFVQDTEDNVDLSRWFTDDLCPSEEKEIGNFFEEYMKSSEVDRFTYSAVCSDEPRRRTKPETGKTSHNHQQDLQEKTKKKEKGNKTSGCSSFRTETGSMVQKRGYSENKSHFEESHYESEKTRKELRDADNLLFFRTMARNRGFLQPMINSSPRPLGLTSQNHAFLTDSANMNFRLHTISDVDRSVLTTPNRRGSSAIPYDHRNFISKDQAEQNMMFFRYIARNKSFFKFN
jgi:hypothetical protein